MWITEVELRNIKSYGSSTRIPFAQGVNSITGPNGAGKSTIVEAIGLALFEAATYNQDQLVREGERNGEIVVSFVDALDEREYQVVRPVKGPAARAYVYDPEIRAKLAVGKEDVSAWLRDHLKVDPTASLSALFTDAVGVPQGLLTAVFQQTTKVRKAQFDPLLQVEDYETAWKKMLETVSHVHNQFVEVREKIAGLQAEVDRLPGLNQQAADLQSQVSGDQKAHGLLQIRLAKARGEKQDLDALKAHLDALTGRLAQLQERREGLVRTLDSARTAVEEAESAARIVNETEAGHRAYEAAQSQIADLNVQRTHRDSLLQKASELKRELALVERDIADRLSDLNGIRQAEERLAGLVPLVEQQDKLEAELKAAELDAGLLESAQMRLREEQGELERLQRDLALVRAGLEKRRSLSQQLASLLAKRNRQDEELGKAQEDLDELQRSLGRAAADLASAQQSLALWRQHEQRAVSESDRLARLEADLAQVREQLRERRTIEADLASLGGKRQQLQRQIAESDAAEGMIGEQRKSLTDRLGVLGSQEDKAACPVCESPLTPERAEELAAHFRDEDRSLGDQLATEQARRRSLESELTGLDGEIAKLTTRSQRLPNLDRESQLMSEMEQQNGVVEHWHAEAAVLAGSARAVQAATEEHSRVQLQFEETQKLQRLARKTRADLDDQVASCQAGIADLPHPDREGQVSADIDAKRQAIHEHEAQASELCDAPERVGTLQSRLAALGDPRGERNLVNAQIGKRPGTEKALAAAQSRQVALADDVAKLDASLGAYEGLDRAMECHQGVLTQSGPDHQRYLKNLQTAQSLDERQRAREKVVAEEQQVAVDSADVEAQRTARQAGYDEPKHRELAEELVRLDRQEAALAERLKGNSAALQRLQADVEELNLKQGELREAEAESLTLARLEKTLRFIRETIRDAGPYVTKRLVQAISVEADRIFGDIMADHALRLQWDEDYAITVECKGEQRVFQQLSGGEQMAAALAVRLALLHEMSDVRIAFFDEPTAHLDDERRDNLAAQITQIKGFDQLFVISHDDTFEQETSHSIRVTKQDGVSRVEVD